MQRKSEAKYGTEWLNGRAREHMSGSQQLANTKKKHTLGLSIAYQRCITILYHLFIA